MASPLTAFLAGMGTLAAVLALGLSTVSDAGRPRPKCKRAEPAAVPETGRGQARSGSAIEQALNAGTRPARSSPRCRRPRSPRPSARRAGAMAACDHASRRARAQTRAGSGHAAAARASGAAIRGGGPRDIARDRRRVQRGAEESARGLRAARSASSIADQARRAHAEGALETRPARGYAQQRRDQAPLGFFGLLFGGDNSR